MNISAPFIKRPVMTTFVMLAILIAGLTAFRKLPVSDLPNIEHPSISVTASYTGATPETMVNLVTSPLEKELMNVKGVKEISSTSSRGSTQIFLEFDFDKNLDEAAREVQTALNRAEGSLPRDMDHRPSYQRKEASNEHILYMVLTSPSASLAEMRDYSDLYIEPRLSRIEGVASVDTFGSPYSIHIKLNPDLMAARQIGLNEVLYAIQQQNSEIPLGSIKTGTRLLSIELPKSMKAPKDFEDIVVAPGPIKLRDIGTVTDKADDFEFHYVTKDKNTLSLIVAIKKQSSANTVAISKAVREVLPQIQKELPNALHFEIWFDKAIWIDQSILDVEWSLAFAFILVVLVIFISLGRVSEALIPSLALPMSLIGTFAAMYLLNFSLDLLSLLALTLCVGFVVDDAIVVLENIVRHNEKGASRMEASLIGSKEICFTVLSMTLSLVAVFIPLLFMGGINGRLFSEFSITLAAAILVSGFVSLTLTPMLCSRMLSKHNKGTKMQEAVAKANKWMVGWYEVSLLWCVRHPKTILLVALACFIATIPLFRTLPINLSPEEDRGFMWTIVNMPKGISDEKATAYQKKIEKMLQDKTYIDNFIDLKWGDAQIFLVKLLPEGQRPPQKQIIKELQGEIDAIPGTQTFIMGYQLFNLNVDIANGGSYQYLVRGMDFSEAEAAAETLKSKMQGKSEFPYVALNVKNDEPKLTVKVQEEKAQRLGFSKKDIQTLLQQAFSGGSIGSIQKKGNQYKVYMELEKKYRNNPAALAKLHLKAANGTSVPLKALATWSESLGSPSIYREDQLPAVTVNFAVNKDVPINKALEEVQKIASETLPVGISGKLYGAAAVVSTALSDTAWLIFAAILVMYIVLGILYESFIHPLTILSSLPFAGLGGVLTLMLFGEPLSLFSLVGFLLLIGIVKKNGIMMVDYALEAQKRTQSPEQAIVDGCLVRFRPIMMTTIAAIMGALPIAIGFGDGAETRRGLGLVIVGGLLFSQMLTLYVTPVLYITFEKLARKKHRQEVSLQGW